MARRLSADEAALWARVVASVTPIKVAPQAPADALPATLKAPPARRAPTPGAALPATPDRARAGLPKPVPAPKPSPPHDRRTLDGSWDRQLARGAVSPDRTVDVHGHNLTTAYATLDRALAAAVRAGERVLLLVTGKPPRPESERPHERGAIRAAVGDWLAASPFAADIAAVRTAHPRHGGQGALYIVLRRRRDSSKN